MPKRPRSPDRCVPRAGSSNRCARSSPTSSTMRAPGDFAAERRPRGVTDAVYALGAWFDRTRGDTCLPQAYRSALQAAKQMIRGTLFVSPTPRRSRRSGIDLPSQYPSSPRPSKDKHMDRPQLTSRFRLHRPRHLRRAAAGRGVGRTARDRADLVERAARRQRRLQRRRVLGGHQTQGRQGGFAAQRRLLQPARTPRCRGTPTTSTREHIDTRRVVLLNVDAPHHTRLRKIISRGFTPRADRTAARRTHERAQTIAKAAAAAGSGRLRRAGVVRAAAAGDRRAARVCRRRTA